jgi:hypothetical protein
MHKIFWLENLKGKRPFGRPRRRWEENIRMKCGRYELDSPGSE